MANSIPVGHYSQLGEQTIKRLSSDDIEYMNFLKYFGRVFKHPVSVALEFYVNRPDSQFIASEKQWKRAGYQVNPTSKGIQFLDTKGNEVTLYDFEDVIGDYPPKRWTITNRNVDAVREKLGLPKDEAFFSALDTSSASAIEDLSLIQELELTDLSNEDKLKFRNSYHNMIQLIIAGRLEINGARYNIQPDRAALELCKDDEQRLFVLSSAASAARKALLSVEYAFDTLKTEFIQRKEDEKNHDLRTVENSQRGTENASSRNGISSDTEKSTGERTDRVPTGEEGRSARLENSSASERTEERNVDTGDNNGNENIRERDDRAAVSPESDRRSVRTDDTERTFNDGRTDRSVRQNVDGEHGEELSGESRIDDVLSQISDGSSFSGQESNGISGAAERTVRQEQSSSDNELRGNSSMGDSEEVRNRSLDNDRSGSRSGDNSLNETYLNDLIFRVSHFRTVFNAVLNSDKENAILEIKEQCKKMLTFMAVENLDEFGKFHDDISAKFNSDEKFFNDLSERIYTDVSEQITPNDRIADKWAYMDVIAESGHDGIDWVYYNPDSTEGGQLVVNHLSHEQLKSSARFEDSYNYLQSVAKQELIDISSADFADTANYYFNLAEDDKALFVCRTGNAKEVEMFIDEYTKKLENSINDSYAEYRDKFPKTRFTSLSDAQKFDYEHHLYVETPDSSIWGEVNNSYRINNGIFEVSTPSHGGIMIKSDIARVILSREAQNTAQKEWGWYYFEEDCDYSVAKRELLDKGLFSNIDNYFSRQYGKKTSEYLPVFSDSLNESLKRWHETYWDSRESAIFNALSPEEQAQKVGQLSFDSDNTAADTEVNDIRNREISKAIKDAKRHIEHIKATNGDPKELATQENMLNFLQYAAENGTEITSDNFKSYVAEHGVDTSSNVSSDSYYEIYQLKSGAELHYHRFTDYDTLRKEGNAVEAKNYNQVYKAELSSGTTLESIFVRLNTEQPENFKGHSISVSDIIVVHDNGDTAAYYVDSNGFKKVPEFLEPEKKNDIVEDFRKKTKSAFKPIDGFTSSDIENLVKDYVVSILDENEIEAEVGQVVVYGSRSRGLEKPDSDIDVVVEIDSELHEDALFNVLHETEREIGGFVVDINPIRKEQTGTLETYLPDAEKYLIEKAETIDNSANEQAIHSGFLAIYANHKYSDKQKLFLERLEKFAVTNNIAENIVDSAFEKAAAFHNTYGNKEFVSRNIFGRRLGSTEKELEAAIKQSLERTTDKEPVTLDDVVAKFFNSDSSEVKSADNTWSINYTDGVEYAEVYHNGDAACAIYLDNDKFTVRPYEELSAIPAMVTRALKAANPDNSVELLEFERTFETPLDKAQYLINSFCENEYGSEADFSNMHRIGIAYTTLTEFELPVQVTADLIDHKITYEFNNEVYDYENFDSIEDMVKNGLTGLDFDSLVSVPDDVIEQHTQELETDNSEKYVNVYMTLSRCKQDCDYALNTADEISSIKGLNKYMFGGSVDTCINTMRDMYSKLPDTEKPEWLSAEDIDNYEIQLNELTSQLESLQNEGLAAEKVTYNTILEVPEYGAVDLKEIDDLYLKDDYSVYEGGIDSDGHERKDNYSSQIRTLTISLDAYGIVHAEEYDSKAEFPPIGDLTFDLSKESEMSELNDIVAKFVKSSESLYITSHEHEATQNNSINETAVDTNINDVEQLTDELNAQTLSEVEVGDVLLLKEPENGDMMYFRIDSMTDNFMVSMTRVADEAGNDYTDIGLGTKSLINGHWRETLLDENTDSPILRFTKNYQEELRQKQNSVDTNINEDAAVDTNINDTITETTAKSHRATRAEMLYREFTEAFPDIANGTHTHERYGAEYDEYSDDNDAFEPLSLENLGNDTYAFMTWYVQNGDLMRDPDFVFTLDHENKELHVCEYQMDGVPSIGTVYQTVELEDGTIDKKLQASLEENFRLNLRNAVAAGRKLAEYTDANGEVHELEKIDEKFIVSEREQPEIHDDSAYYREALNAFSEKHGLGELNITPNSNGFHITEKYQDGASAPLWYISKPYAEKPLTAEELEAELTAFEAAAEKNNTSVENYGYRKNNINNHGGSISELPPVQENLPEIKYADNPTSKVRDNITAIREAKRIEECENNGIYPFGAGRNDYNSVEASMARLRRYSGWGGVSQVFDERFPTMLNLRKQLKEMLTPEEYAAARSSTLTSHYTPQIIIDEMYKTIRNMGLPKDSRILEPSCGTGNFISRMPHDMGNGGIVGVELDSITAKIAKYLNVPKENPYAKKDEKALEESRDIKILNCGFESSNLENNSFDLVIGNVPFGDFKLNDPDYTDDLLIHDAFFRKALDKVAPGGVVAFITSSGTLDKKNPKIREQLAMKADLIGAVRLPNNAFADADTKVTSDIIFLQKRKTPLNVYDPKPEWCYTTPVEVEMVGKKYEGEKKTAFINSYFAKNPQMVLGTMKQTTHFDMLTCEPDNSKPLKEQLETAFRQLNAKISIDKRERSNLEKRGYIEPWGKSFTYQVKDDKVLYNLGNAMEEVSGDKKKIAKLKSLCELRDITRELLNKQLSYAHDDELIPLRNKLNEAYDSFVKENGNLTSKNIKKLFSQDADYPILSALETVDSETQTIKKADIFTRRTVNPVAEVKEVATAEEAMQVSLDKRGKVDIPYMATLLKNQYENVKLDEAMKNITEELLEKGLVFRDPEKIATDKPYVEIVDKSEYLCGNVRKKLAMAEYAASQDSSYENNVSALKEVIPEEIGAAEISVDIGCTWIDTDDYEKFMRSLSGRTEYDSRFYSVRFSEITGKFSIENAHSRNGENYRPNEISTYGTEDMNMYHIMENLLNQKKIQVFDYFPDPKDPNKVKSVLNKNKTQVAQSKAKAIKQKFTEWIFASEERREKYVKRYNEKFNNLVGRSYDGSHLTFSGIANNFKLRPHQLDCVARTIYGGNTLAAHCVGAGKSAVIAASVMKKKELGLIHKACVVVPKPLTEQTEREWRTSFPDAKLLVVDNKDLSDEKKREIFTARVATGDYDAIIMSQEQYEKLPMSAQHQLEFLNKQCAEMQDQLVQCKRNSGRKDPTVKELEQAIKKIQNRIDSITNPKSKSRGKDSLLNFESLGFDYLVVDEAHSYKNGYVMTKMGDVSGVNTRESGRAGDMQMKCDYFNSEFGNGHILFATGTPYASPYQH